MREIETIQHREGRAKTARARKRPKQCYLNSLFRLGGGRASPEAIASLDAAVSLNLFHLHTGKYVTTRKTQQGHRPTLRRRHAGLVVTTPAPSRSRGPAPGQSVGARFPQDSAVRGAASWPHVRPASGQRVGMAFCAPTTGRSWDAGALSPLLSASPCLSYVSLYRGLRGGFQSLSVERAGARSAR